jgi:hypothetical protein
MLPTNCSSFGNAVSEKIFRNRPIRNKNFLWQPCLLTDMDEMSNVYRGPTMNASYQVSVHLAKRFQRRRFKKKSTNHKPELTVVASLFQSKKAKVLWIDIIWRNYMHYKKRYDIR